MKTSIVSPQLTHLRAPTHRQANGIGAEPRSRSCSLARWPFLKHRSIVEDRRGSNRSRSIWHQCSKVRPYCSEASCDDRSVLALVLVCSCGAPADMQAINIWALTMSKRSPNKDVPRGLDKISAFACEEFDSFQQAVSQSVASIENAFFLVCTHQL